MDNVVLRTARTEMKFPLQLITPQTLVNAIGDEETIQFMAAKVQIGIVIPIYGLHGETFMVILNYYSSDSFLKKRVGVICEDI